MRPLVSTLTTIVSTAVMLSVAMSFPKTTGLLGFVFLVPILLYINSLSIITRPDNRTLLFKSWLVTFVSMTLVTLISTVFLLKANVSNWIHLPPGTSENITIYVIWLLFGMLSGIILSLWSIGYVLINKKAGVLYNSLSGAALWTVIEYTKAWIIGISIAGPGSLLGAHHTYYSIGYLGVHLPFFKEVIAIGGIYLATFLFVVANFFFFQVLIKERTLVPTKTLFHFLIITVILSAAGMFLLRPRSSTEPVPVVIMNTNIPSAPNSSVLTVFANEAADQLAQINTTSFIAVLPETIDIYGRTEAAKKELLAEKQVVIISSQSSPKNPNKLFYYQPKTEEILFSDKRLLFPAGEYEMWWLGLLLGKPARVSEPPSKVRVLFTDPFHANTVIGGVICSESLSPIIHRELVRNGATFITNSTSHAAFDGSEQLQRQIKAVNIARALETGRYIAVATNFNNSYVIQDNGSIAAELKFSGQTNYLEVSIKPKKYLTPYARLGDVIIWISILLLLLAIKSPPRYPRYKRKRHSATD